MKILFRVLLIFTMIAVLITTLAIWGPVGSMVVEPLVRRYGESSIPALKVKSVDGSLYAGITLNGISLTSGDDTLLDADHLLIRPSWDELLHGTLWLSDLEIFGVRANVEKLSDLASRYGGKTSGTSSGPAIKPIRVMLRDITFDTPMYPIGIDAGFLTQDGSLSLSADLGGLPVSVNGRLNFEPLEALSLDVSIGSGRAFLEGKLNAPFDIKGELLSVKLGELLAVVPEASAVAGKGDITGRFNVMGAGEHLGAWGSLALENGSAAGLPIETSASWRYKNGVFSLASTKMKAISADVRFTVSADLRPVPVYDRFMVRGAASGISMKNLERALSLDVNLDGDNGIVDFWVSADQTGKTAGKVFARLANLKANGKQVVKGLRATALLYPDKSVSLDCTGEVFGAKLSSSGSAALAQGNGNVDMLFTADGIDSALVADAFPALKSAAPSGKLDLSVRLGGQASDRRVPFSLSAEAVSPALTLAGVKLTSLSASARYENGTVMLDGLNARIGKAPLNISGTLNLAASALRFDGAIKGLDPGAIPKLTGVTGVCDVTVAARGTVKSPEITATVNGGSNTVMNIPINRLALSCVYADDKLTIPKTALSIPGGSLSFNGSVALPRGGEPVLDMACSFKNLDLKAYSKIFNMDMAGRVNAAAALSGPISKAAVSAAVTSEAMTVLSADVRGLDLEVSGTTRSVEVRRVKAAVNEGDIEGKGNMTFGRNGRMQIDMKVSGLEIRSLLARYGLDAGVGGYLDGELSLHGSPRRPELKLNVTSPLTIKETLLDRLSVNINSPARGKIGMDASARMGDFDFALKANMERGSEGWGYSAESGLIDLDKLISAKTPSMKGQISGNAKFQITGRLKGRRGGETTPVNINITVPSVSFAGIKVEDVTVPIRVSGSKAAVHQGAGVAYDGKILIDGDVDMSKKQWEMTAKVASMDIGQAAGPFLTQGALVGKADINVKAKGDYGSLMMVFANGDFKTGEGDIHGIDAMKSITEDGRISFKEIRGSFFWDGSDLWLNPGTQATAQPRDILYKYLSVNGSMGVKGKGLGLNFNGNFNVKALDTLLSGIKGIFQLTTGSLTGGTQLVRQAVGKIIGFTERDFQDVSFQLKGSWKELQLLNLKINMLLENYMPIKTSDSLPTEKEDDKKIQFNIKIPTGPGGEDGETTEDQFKKQLLDNLLNWYTP